LPVDDFRPISAGGKPRSIHSIDHKTEVQPFFVGNGILIGYREQFRVWVRADRGGGCGRRLCDGRRQRGNGARGDGAED
jgi:hypothetical protein